ncbi:Ribonuclease H [Abeliophyllum distichum]|uniref:Ribonuclease H n=1 Tax=Abeliophyllum distichum TaxID=126358 RepID=A0ABD1V423_9LAMI
MVSYLTKAKDLLSHFKVYELLQIPRVENGYADALSKLASSRDSDLMKPIPVEKLNRPSIDESFAPTAMTISESPEVDEGDHRIFKQPSAVERQTGNSAEGP